MDIEKAWRFRGCFSWIKSEQKNPWENRND